MVRALKSQLDEEKRKNSVLQSKLDVIEEREARQHKLEEANKQSSTCEL